MEEHERRIAVIRSGATDVARWSDPRNLERSWEPRAIAASAHIAAGSRVLDLGCGSMHLERALPFACFYQPCDVVSRDERTIVADLNAGQFPAAAAANSDVVVMLGVWEYVFDADQVFAKLAAAGKPIVCSYCDSGSTPHQERRRGLGWVNDFTIDQFIAIAARHGFVPSSLQRIDDLQHLFRFAYRPVARRSSGKRVHVIAYNNLSNFGDRLGFHVIQDVLPVDAEVSWGRIRPFDPVPKDVDLVVLGIGNSLYGDLIDHNLVSAISAAKASVGIFGTQYRQAMKTDLLDELVGSLGHWFARYEEDVLLYGRNKPNVSHLGDWLINQFALAVPTIEHPLRIGAEALSEASLDRFIQNVQLHKRVHSGRLHPLLCALTSAEQVSYSEQREFDGKLSSGKFRSLLMDVFSRTYPENIYWKVERDLVAGYKAKVKNNINVLRDYISGILT